MLESLRPIRDQVLGHANLGEGEVLLDVGCGDGLIAFGALEQFAGAQVIFSDISQDLLDHARAVAIEMDVLHRCRFLPASADDLSALGDASVDAVTTRSVLIYVSAKQKAFDEFHRVLRPGGRLSIFEPINAYPYPEDVPATPEDRDTGIEELRAKVRAVYRRYQPEETDPMLDFDERDLLAMAWRAGFEEVHLRVEVEVVARAKGGDWEAYLHSAPNPKAPTPAEAIREALTPAEAERYVAYLRPRVEGKQGTSRYAWAYLWAVKRGHEDC
jgi:ubiquinone/menaquinone biosynthesis C-methylase UbiE